MADTPDSNGSLIDMLGGLIGRGKDGAISISKGGIKNVVAWAVKLLASTPIMATANRIGRLFGIDAEDWLIKRLSGWLDYTGSEPEDKAIPAQDSPARLHVQQELLLHNSSSGKAMLTQLRAAGITIKPGNPGQTSAVCTLDESGHPTVLTGGSVPCHSLPSMIVALRHASQAKLGFAGANSGLSPEGQIFYDRFAKADAEAVAVQIAHELLQEGYDKPWKLLRGNFHGRLLTDAYLDAVAADPAAATSGAALRATFDRWFTLSYPEKVSVDQSLARLAQNPPVQPAGGWRTLRADDLQRLGLVSGTNYLNNGRPLDDPHYRLDVTADQAARIAALSSPPPAAPVQPRAISRLKAAS